MTAIANTYTTATAKGIREDLSNLISNIAPEETPILTAAGSGSISNTLYEWQTDDLASAGANSKLEGDETTFTASTPTVRLSNYAQISSKDVIVSGTLDAVNKAGRKSELAYQISKRAKEIKRDMEFIISNGQIARAEAGATTRQTASLQAFIKTNTSKGVGGVDPVYTTLPNNARTDGTQRAFTEALVKDVCQKIWNQGGKLDMMVVGAFNKQVASTFSGIAQNRTETGKKVVTIVAAADVYISDFGAIQIVADRFSRSRDALLLDRDMISVDMLRNYRVEERAKTGDAEKREMLCEWGLKVLNEKAIGGVFDLTTA